MKSSINARANFCFLLLCSLSNNLVFTDGNIAGAMEEEDDYKDLPLLIFEPESTDGEFTGFSCRDHDHATSEHCALGVAATVELEPSLVPSPWTGQ
jgi:hypothetical protein